MVPPAILPSPAVLCGECLPTELRDKHRKYLSCSPQGSRVAAQSLGLFGLQLLGGGGCGDVWGGWRSPGAFGGNSWVLLGPLPAGGIHPLQFHLLLATVQGRLGHKLCWERGGWESPGCHSHQELCSITQGFGSGSSGKDRGLGRGLHGEFIYLPVLV